MDHVSGGLFESRFADVVARFFSHDDLAYIRSKFLIGSTAQHSPIKIVVALGKQAGADLAVRCDANAAAVSAERLRDRGDDADLAYAIVEGKSLRRLAGGVRRELDQGTECIQASDDLVHRNNGFRLPAAVFFEGHPLDEADDDAFAAGELGEGSIWDR